MNRDYSIVFNFVVYPVVYSPHLSPALVSRNFWPDSRLKSPSRILLYCIAMQFHTTPSSIHCS
jgi:hypothetical protein